MTEIAVKVADLANCVQPLCHSNVIVTLKLLGDDGLSRVKVSS